MTAAPAPRRRLALRVYALTAALSLLVMVALLVLPRYMRGARYLEPQAALLQYMVDRLSLKDAARFGEAMDRIEPRVRGRLSLYAADGHVVRSMTTPPLPPATPEERALLGAAKWALSQGRIVARSDDATLIAVYAPNRPGFPWHYVLPMCAVLLVAAGAASVWFSRRLARPLEQLATAARRFGAGDVEARAALARADELGDVGRAFDDMAERTGSVLQAQRQLLADVSHELRTPLSRIRVALELAAEDPAAAKDLLADAGADLDEIDQLIGDILTAARLDATATPLAHEPTSVGELADRARRRFAQKHPRRTLVQEVDDPERAITCEPRLLRRALDNLLDNAAKYSEPGTPIELAVVPDGTTVVFEVRDRGVGMTPEELDHAFTPFWRADGSRTRRTGGVGLGLPLARRIARAHGGDVTLTSTAGRGTVARLDVPLLLAPEGPGDAPAARPPEPA